MPRTLLIAAAALALAPATAHADRPPGGILSDGCGRTAAQCAGDTPPPAPVLPGACRWRATAALFALTYRRPIR